MVEQANGLDEQRNGAAGEYESLEQQQQREAEEAIFGAERMPELMGISRADLEAATQTGQEEQGVDESGQPITGTADGEQPGNAFDESGQPITGAADGDGQQQQAGQSGEDKPLMVLERFGQRYEVRSYEEARSLASMGLDYTKKMQELSGFRNVLMALNQHPDLASELQRRMSGEPPAPVGQYGQAKPSAQSQGQTQTQRQTQPDILTAEELRQGDDETNEQYMARVTRLAAQRAAEQANQTAQAEVAGVRAEFERQQANAQILEGYKADPLFGITGKVLHHMVSTGQIPPSLAMKANNDPDVFQALYNQARVQAQSIAQQYAARAAAERAAAAAGQAPGQSPNAAQQQGGTNRVRVTRSAAPVVEASGAGRRTQGGDRDTVRTQVLADMDPEKFRQLREAIKSGDTGAWGRLGQ